LTGFEPGIFRINDDVRLAVQHLLEIFEGDVENVADTRGQALQEPNVSNRGSQVDVPQAFPANLGLDHLDAALLAHDAAVLHALVLAADALVILYRAKDLRAEQTIPFRLERPIVDRLRLLHLAVRPLPDLLRARQRNAHGGERQWVFGLLE